MLVVVGNLQAAGTGIGPINDFPITGAFNNALAAHNEVVVQLIVGPRTWFHFPGSEGITIQFDEAFTLCFFVEVHPIFANASTVSFEFFFEVTNCFEFFFEGGLGDLATGIISEWFAIPSAKENTYLAPGGSVANSASSGA